MGRYPDGTQYPWNMPIISYLPKYIAIFLEDPVNMPNILYAKAIFQGYVLTYMQGICVFHIGKIFHLYIKILKI